MLSSTLRTHIVASAHGRRAASSIALKYSNALYAAALAKSPQVLSKVQSELNSISKSIAETPELNAFISNPTLSAKERVGGLPSLYAKGKEPVSDITKNLFAVLSENGRLNETQGVINGFNELVAKYKGELEVIVTSATPLSKDTTTRLESVLRQSQTAQNAKSVKMVNKVRVCPFPCCLVVHRYTGQPFAIGWDCRRLWRQEHRPQRVVTCQQTQQHSSRYVSSPSGALRHAHTRDRIHITGRMVGAPRERSSAVTVRYQT